MGVAIGADGSYSSDRGLSVASWPLVPLVASCPSVDGVSTVSRFSNDKRDDLVNVFTFCKKICREEELQRLLCTRDKKNSLSLDNMTENNNDLSFKKEGEFTVFPWFGFRGVSRM